MCMFHASCCPPHVCYFNHRVSHQKWERVREKVFSSFLICIIVYSMKVDLKFMFALHGWLSFFFSSSLPLSTTPVSTPFSPQIFCNVYRGILLCWCNKRLVQHICFFSFPSFLFVFHFECTLLPSKIGIVFVHKAITFSSFATGQFFSKI